MSNETIVDLAGVTERLRHCLHQVVQEHEIQKELLELRTIELSLSQQLVTDREELLSMALSSIPDGFAIVDGRGVVQIANPNMKHLFGLAKDEVAEGRLLGEMLKNIGFKDIWNGSDGLSAFEDAFLTRHIAGNAVIVLAGDERYLELYIGPRAEAGTPITIRDVTKRVASERPNLLREPSRDNRVAAAGH